MGSTKRKSMLYLALDSVLGSLPRKAIILIEIVGASFTILAAVDIGLRIVVGIVTIGVGWYAIQANKSKKALDDLQAEKVREELKILKEKVKA